MLGLYWFVRPFQRCNENMSGMPASSPTRYLRGEAVQQSSCKWSPGVKRIKLTLKFHSHDLRLCEGTSPLSHQTGSWENHLLKSAGKGWGNM